MSHHRALLAVRGLVVRVTLAGALVAAAPTLAAAQDKVHDAAELTTKPKITSMARTAQLVLRSYPPKLKNAGVNGTVQVQFVVGPNGKVEESSVEVLAASVPALGEAARDVASKLEFEPGKVNDAPVRARVMLPIVYKAR